MTLTADARATLTAALVDALAPLVVTDTRPDELAAPCGWVDVARRRLGDADGAPIVVVTFPVIVVVDGADPEQVRALDDIGDAIWQTALELDAAPVTAEADTVDVGGPSLRNLITLVDVVTEYLTLCPPDLTRT